MTNDVMKELVTMEQATAVIRVLAVALPPAGILLGALVGARRRRLRQGTLVGLLAGLSGPAIWLLWNVYNRIMGRFGLDSVAGLLINLALFAVIGIALGVAIGLGRRRRAPAATTETTSPGRSS